MRNGTVRIALGIEVRGFFASPAAMPMFSMPPKANITTVKQARKPVKPFAKKPPSRAQRFVTEGPTSSCACTPTKSRAMPPTIMAIMALTFTSVNQNSASPKALTFARLMASRISSTETIQIHEGLFGNQNFMYTAKAVTSATATSAISRA